AHGFDLAHQELILKAVKPPKDTTNATAANAIHTLSVANARELWSEQAITDQQYEQVLIAHGYDSTTAGLQLQADRVSAHIKAQKAELADLSAQVELGVMSLDDASAQLVRDGFTTPQVNRFQLTLVKKLAVAQKTPGIPDLTKFFKAGLITIDQYKTALIQLGWQDPWLTAYLGLVSNPATIDTTAGQTS
ncbi:MAG: hypothetical protein RB191_24920, partial [Terriglobia bacterium]|nr:hypothetical protein [Terriglobia bacterium]